MNQKKNPLKSHIYANAYLEKAKFENTTFFIAQGWVLASDLYKEDEIYLTYMDSIIKLTEVDDNKEFPARAYLLKGDYFYRKQLFSDALSNYKLASQFAMQKTNPRIIYESNRFIGLINSSLEMHKNALKLFRESYEYAVKEEMDSELEDLYFLSHEFNELKLLDSALHYNAIGIEKSLKTDKKTLYRCFVLNSGITKYYKREYQKAIDSVNKVLPDFERNGSAFDLIEPYLYLGKAYDKLNEKNKSVFFLKKMDSVAGISGSMNPDVIEGYGILVEDYKQRGISKRALLYSKKLSRIDSLLANRFTDSLKTIVAAYKTPKIVSDDHIRITDLKKETLYFKLVAILTVPLLLIIIGLLVSVYKDRNQYKKSFNAVVAYTEKLSEETEPKVKEEKDKKLNDLNISQETVDVILKGISKFEKNNRYLNKKYSLSILAKEINTNSTYLSKVINIYMEKSFSNYLHDLRIGYAVDRLREDRQFRLYSIKGISEEVGFKNSESFSKAFHKKTGIYPSAFIKKLQST